MAFGMLRRKRRASLESAASVRNVFISYARENGVYVARLVERLREHDVDAWFDRDIEAGRQWATQLRQQMAASAAIVLVMSPAAARSKWVRIELRAAGRLAKPILPLLLAGALFRKLANVQYESVEGEVMPSDAFIDRLRELTGAKERPPRRLALFQEGVIPLTVNHFQQRGEVAIVEAALASDRGAAFIVQLSGMGGVGKTQLATVVAARQVRRHNLDVFIWANASSRDSVVSDYARR
jgi:hypothetical protein